MSVMSKIRRRSHTDELVPALPELREVVATDARCIVAIGDVQWRQHVCVTGKVRSVRVQPWAGVATLECTLIDATGGLSVVFLGRRRVAGIHPGSRLTVEGMVG